MDVDEEPTEREAQALDRYLVSGKPRPGGGPQIVSTFWALVRDAREATGRDADTGEIVERSRLGNWLGAIAYLCFIDQIGGAVRRRSRDPQPSSGTAFELAFHNFANLELAEGRALYALRCALAHDYSLTNKKPNQPDLQHVFTLYPDGPRPLVVLPRTPWNGNYVGIPPDGSTKTRINLRRLGDLCELIVREVLEAHAGGDLDVRPGTTGSEVLVRYGFQTEL